MEKILFMVFPFEFHYTYLRCYLETSCGSKHQKKSKQLGKFYEVFQVVGVFLEPQQSTFRQALPWCLTTNGWESFSLKNSNT